MIVTPMTGTNASLARFASEFPATEDPTMSQRLNNLNAIISVLDAGAQFYRKASRQVTDDELAALFTDIAETRETATRQLSEIVDTQGGEPASASTVEIGRMLYAKAASLFGDTNRNLIAHLEEHEDRTLEVFRKAIRDKDNAADEEMLREMMQHFQASHDRLRSLKKADEPKTTEPEREPLALEKPPVSEARAAATGTVLPPERNAWPQTTAN